MAIPMFMRLQILLGAALVSPFIGSLEASQQVTQNRFGESVPSVSEEQEEGADRFDPCSLNGKCSPREWPADGKHRRRVCVRNERPPLHAGASSGNREAGLKTHSPGDKLPDWTTFEAAPATRCTSAPEPGKPATRPEDPQHKGKQSMPKNSITVSLDKPKGQIERLKLVLAGLKHSKESFAVRVFVNAENPDQFQVSHFTLRLSLMHAFLPLFSCPGFFPSSLRFQRRGRQATQSFAQVRAF